MLDPQAVGEDHRGGPSHAVLLLGEGPPQLRRHPHDLEVLAPHPSTREGLRTPLPCEGPVRFGPTRQGQVRSGGLAPITEVRPGDVLGDAPADGTGDSHQPIAAWIGKWLEEDPSTTENTAVVDPIRSASVTKPSS